MARIPEDREYATLLRSRHRRGYDKHPTIHGRSLILSTSAFFYFFSHFAPIKNSSVSGYIISCDISRWNRHSIYGPIHGGQCFCFPTFRPNRRFPSAFHSSTWSPDDSFQDSDDTVLRNNKLNQRNGYSLSNRPYWEIPEEVEENDDSIFPPSTPTVPSQSKGLLEVDVFEWEKYATDFGTAWVLLPPLSVIKPTCIIHFVGGTLMGSAPQIWYRGLLQDLVRHTSCAIIATSIPVALSRSPLNHVRLSSQLLDQFRVAYDEVVVDEYGRDVVQSIPICGMGHSLGARLLTVSTTMTLGQIRPSRIGQTSLSYKSMILISFTNYGAAAGIPGVATLFRKSRNVERQAQQLRTPTKRTKTESKWWDDDDVDDGNNFDFDDENNWSTLWDDVSDVVQLGATRIQNALTPPSESLEFHPTPEDLWTAIQTNSRYNIPHTLLVQFDDDEIDQSARLATAITNCSDVKFARLRGTHLTPIARSDQMDAEKRARHRNASFMQRINTQAERILANTLQGQLESKRNAVAFLELRQSIARYVIEIASNKD